MTGRPLDRTPANPDRRAGPVADAAQSDLEQATALYEELQAANEELVAGQGQLQALNAELAAANARLRDQAAELEAATSDLTCLLASTDLPVLFLDPALRIRRFTPAARDLFDLLPADVGRPLADLHPKVADPDLLADARAVFDRLVPAEREVPGEGGRHYLRRAHPYRTRDDRIDGVVLAFVDVTERKRLEGRAGQAQKMEAVGRLAGGIAHDFNNLLTVINGYCDLLLDRLPAADPSRPVLAEVRKAGERSAALTRQLLAFSRQQVLAPRVLDPNAVVADLASLLRRLIGEDVRLDVHLAPDARPVRADPGQLEQVLVNLCVNARDAMPAGGRLTVATRNADVGPAEAAAHPDARPGPHAVLAVADTGVGMPDAVRARVFDPFFTTKGPGRGTGLGLATVHGIVTQAGGHVRVRSREGAGSTFEVFLPWAGAAAVAADTAARSGVRPLARGGETVLVVEDEDGVRAFVRAVLEGAGYVVLEAADGEAAVVAAAAHPGPVHLLLTDVVMPAAGGRAVAERLAAARPGVRVLYASGYPDDAVVQHGIRTEAVHFLPKPFTPADLTAAVRRVLDGGRPGESG